MGSVVFDNDGFYCGKELETILAEKSNDYGELENIFYKKTWAHLREGLACSAALKPASIIIPAYNLPDYLKKCLLSIQMQTVMVHEAKNIELIIVEDCSEENILDAISPLSFPCHTRYIQLKKNVGRAKARNIGTAYAKNEIIFYFDSDMIIHAEYIEQHLIRQSLLNNLILVGFKENINFENNRIADEIIIEKQLDPDYHKDFRYQKDLSKFLSPQEREDRVIRVYEETDGFKHFGFRKKIGTWDLPTMVVSNNMSVPRDAVIKVGGFGEQFKGWGLEDTYLGAKLIATGLYVAPYLSSSSYHIKHPPRKGDEEDKKKDMMRNWMLYQGLLEKSLPFVTEKEFFEQYKNEEAQIWVLKN